MPPIGPHHTSIRSQPEYLALAKALAKEQVFGKRRGQLAVLVLVRREMLQAPLAAHRDGIRLHAGAKFDSHRGSNRNC